MSVVDALIDRLSASALPVFWQGPASKGTIDELERLLSTKLPPSFRSFLLKVGGGGVEGAEISGIESDNPLLEHRGTVLGDTKQCRRRFGLPPHLSAIVFTDDEVCWCLDSSRLDSAGECAVVSYSLTKGRVDALIAPNFTEFLREYVELRT